MDQTVLGIIILIVIWVLSAIANRKKKTAAGQQGQQTADRKQQARQEQFGTQTPKRIRFDTQTGQPIYDTEPSVYGDQDHEQTDPIDQYLATINARREEEMVEFQISEPDDEEESVIDQAQASIEASRKEQKAIEHRIREIRARASTNRADAAVNIGRAVSTASVPAIGINNRADLIRAIIFAEILSKPKSRRRGSRL